MAMSPDPAGRGVGPASAGFLAGGGGLLTLLVASWLTGANGLLELVANGLTAFVPVPIFDAVLRTLGPLAKGLLFAAIAAAVPVAGAILAWVLARVGLLRSRPAGGGRAWSSAISDVAGVLVVGLLVVELVVLPIAGAGLFGQEAPGSLVALQATVLAAALVYAVLLVTIVRQRARLAREARLASSDAGHPGVIEAVAAAPVASEVIATARVDRRAFLAGTAAVVGLVSLVASGAIVLGRVAVAAARPLGPEAGAPLADAWGVSSRLTPVEDFYTVAKDLVPPSVDGATWRLDVDGLVERPGAWTAERLRTLPRVEGPRTLQCISNEVVRYGSLIGNQRWGGVRMRDLLDAVGVRPEARFVHWEAADGFTESIQLEVALDGETWLVDSMGPDGAPLPVEHGFPLRVFIAGRYGMKQPKWLTRVVLADTDEPGYWVKRGWDETAAVHTYSRIDAPLDGATVAAGELAMYGVASSGDRGISRVEVSADDGATWTDAELEPPGDDTNDLTWRRWRATVRVPAGAVVLVARATDGESGVQDAAERPPLPSGATGLHRVRIAAVEG